MIEYDIVEDNGRSVSTGTTYILLEAVDGICPATSDTARDGSVLYVRHPLFAHANGFPPVSSRAIPFFPLRHLRLHTILALDYLFIIPFRSPSLPLPANALTTVTALLRTSRQVPKTCSTEVTCTQLISRAIPSYIKTP